MLDKEHRFFVAGPESAERLVFFQGGFPDDQSAFIDFALRIAGENSLVAISCLPEFDCDGSKPLQRPDGYTFNETAICFGQAVDAFRKEAGTPDLPLTLVLHDFGVITGLLWTNRRIKAGIGAPAKLVIFDVLPPDMDGNIRDRVIHLVYQSQFAICFVLSRFCNILAGVWYSVTGFWIFGVLGYWLTPIGLPDLIKGGSRSLDISAVTRMSYPYRNVFREMLVSRGTLRNELKLPAFGTSLPLLYMYGANKNTMFHTADSLAALDAADGCKQIAIQDAGHWLFLQKPEQCWQHLKKFVL
jgi:pimeloyl-ACP methyl ester carboxylesterase